MNVKTLRGRLLLLRRCLFFGLRCVGGFGFLFGLIGGAFVFDGEARSFHVAHDPISLKAGLPA